MLWKWKRDGNFSWLSPQSKNIRDKHWDREISRTFLGLKFELTFSAYVATSTGKQPSLICCFGISCSFLFILFSFFPFKKKWVFRGEGKKSLGAERVGTPTSVISPTFDYLSHLTYISPAKFAKECILFLLFYFYIYFLFFFYVF